MGTCTTIFLYPLEQLPQDNEVSNHPFGLEKYILTKGGEDFLIDGTEFEGKEVEEEIGGNIGRTDSHIECIDDQEMLELEGAGGE